MGGNSTPFLSAPTQGYRLTGSCSPLPFSRQVNIVFLAAVTELPTDGERQGGSGSSPRAKNTAMEAWPPHFTDSLGKGSLPSCLPGECSSYWTSLESMAGFYLFIY